MKRPFAITAVIFLLMGAATAFAANSPVCQLQGSWMGYDENGYAFWVNSVQGRSSSSGTYIVESPGAAGIFPEAVLGGTLRGVWTRTGGRTFAVTLIGLAVDSAGNTLYIAKLIATDTLSEDCNSMWIENSFEFFSPDQNPFEDEPFYATPAPGHWGYRIRVDTLE